jgi:hypothetical protein
MKANPMMKAKSEVTQGEYPGLSNKKAKWLKESLISRTRAKIRTFNMFNYDESQIIFINTDISHYPKEISGNFGDRGSLFHF